MPLPVRKKSRRLSPSRRALRSPRAVRRSSTALCSGDCGGGTNSSLEAMRVGIGGGASLAASRSHWRTHIGPPPAGMIGHGPLQSLREVAVPQVKGLPGRLALAAAGDRDRIPFLELARPLLGRLVLFVEDAFDA